MWGVAQSGKDLVRVFCAIELPAEARALAEAHMARLRAAAPDADARWERAEKLHLTLKFLGGIAPERVAALMKATERAASCSQALTLRLEGSGAFPPRGLPRVLWLGVVDPTERLAELWQKLEEECAREGFARETRAFHPHLTIARLRTPAGARQLAAAHSATTFAPIDFPIAEIIVMRSDLGPTGSRYTPLSRHALKGSRP
jgi:2'-5' RNA ligase